MRVRLDDMQSKQNFSVKTFNSSPVNSSQSQLVTRKHITKPPVVFFYLHAGQVAPRNSAHHGRRT